MQSDLHHAVRRTYRQAMAQGMTQREAFDLALTLVLGQDPQPARAARRAVAVTLAYELLSMVEMSPGYKQDQEDEPSDLKTLIE